MTTKFIDDYLDQAEIDQRTTERADKIKLGIGCAIKEPHLRVLFEMYLDTILQAKDCLESRGIKYGEFPQMMNDLLKLFDEQVQRDKLNTCLTPLVGV